MRFCKVLDTFDTLQQFWTLTPSEKILLEDIFFSILILNDFSESNISYFPIYWIENKDFLKKKDNQKVFIFYPINRQISNMNILF